VTGLLAAGFAPDGSWLAICDGLGRLWRVDSASGATQLIADGPFAGSLLVEPGGSILALAVSSVEAPFMSHLVRLGPAGQAAEMVSDAGLVYAMAALADGSLAVVSHRPAGTLIQRLADGQVVSSTDLGSGAVNVSMSSDGAIVAWEQDGQLVVRSGQAPARVLGPGQRPRVAPNGRMVLVDAAAGGTSVLSVDGELIAQLTGPVALLDCGECRP